jgi:hypothetical protein
MNRQVTRQEQVAEQIMDLLESDDETILIMEGYFVRGPAGPNALCLMGNCLARAFDLKPIRVPIKRCSGTRVAKFKSALNRFARKRDPWWVLCYHLDGTDDWGMAWSAGLSREDAAEQFIRLLPLWIYVDFTNLGVKIDGAAWRFRPCRGSDSRESRE